MINFFETCKAQIDSAFGEGMETFLEISGEQTTASGMLAPRSEWRRQLRVKDYTTKKTEYIHSIWETAANTFQSIDRADAIEEGQSSAVTNIARHLRPRADLRAAAQTKRSIGFASTLITEIGQSKKKAVGRTTSKTIQSRQLLAAGSRALYP